MEIIIIIFFLFCFFRFMRMWYFFVIVHGFYIKIKVYILVSKLIYTFTTIYSVMSISLRYMPYVIALKLCSVFLWLKMLLRQIIFISILFLYRSIFIVFSFHLQLSRTLWWVPFGFQSTEPLNYSQEVGPIEI